MNQTDQLMSTILGRSESFLANDIARSEQAISTAVAGQSFLVIGGAGSIGSAFTSELVRYGVGSLHLLDISENNLVEVVRELRSSSATIPADFRTYAFDFTDVEMEALLRENQYDYVLNFSALKHVRSERDPYTLMRLLKVNVLGNEGLIRQLQMHGKPKRLFSVSSDKSVRPGNLMGASKALMERILLRHSDSVPFSSARFANVAFSDGSLLHGFRFRLQKRQPLTAPSDVRRYFISPREAGQLCLLGCLCCDSREIVYPLFQPASDMMTFAEIARVFLETQGLRPLECGSEQEAREVAARLPESPREWPCFFSHSDTSGEKPFEEFVDPAETTCESRFGSVGVITHPLRGEPAQIDGFVRNLSQMRSRKSWSLEELTDLLRKVIPELQHVTSDRNLDQKM